MRTSETLLGHHTRCHSASPREASHFLAVGYRGWSDPRGRRTINVW